MTGRWSLHIPRNLAPSLGLSTCTCSFVLYHINSMAGASDFHDAYTSAWLSGVPMLARSFLLVCELRKAVIAPLLEFADLICRSATVGRANARGQGGLPVVPSPGERKKGGVCVCACFSHTHSLYTCICMLRTHRSHVVCKFPQTKTPLFVYLRICSCSSQRYHQVTQMAHYTIRGSRDELQINYILSVRSGQHERLFTLTTMCKKHISQRYLL